MCATLLSHHYKPLSLPLTPPPPLLPFPLLLPLQVHLGNQQTIVGLITFQTPVPFPYLLYVVLPVLAAVILGLLLVVVCCVCIRRKACTGGDR